MKYVYFVKIIFSKFENYFFTIEPQEKEYFPGLIFNFEKSELISLFTRSNSLPGSSHALFFPTFYHPGIPIPRCLHSIDHLFLRCDYSYWYKARKSEMRMNSSRSLSLDRIIAFGLFWSTSRANWHSHDTIMLYTFCFIEMCKACVQCCFFYRINDSDSPLIGDVKNAEHFPINF